MTLEHAQQFLNYLCRTLDDEITPNWLGKWKKKDEICLSLLQTMSLWWDLTLNLLQCEKFSCCSWKSGKTWSMNV